MSQPPLTTTETTALQGPTFCKTYLSVIPLGTPLATAVVDQAVLDPTDTILTNTTSANWLNCTRNMTVWIDSSNASIGHNRGIYRLRLDNTTTTALSINQSSYADAGLLPTQLRTAGITAGDKIAIYDKLYAAWAVFPRLLYNGGQGVFYKDFSTVYVDQNSFPSPVLRMNIYKPNGSNPDIYLGNHAAVFLDDGQTYATVKLVTDYSLWPTSSSISTYAGTCAGATVVSGSLNSASAMVQLPVGVYVWKMTITTSNSRTATGYRLIIVHDTGANAPLPIASVSSDGRDTAGRKVSLQLNDDVLSNIPDGSMCIFWDVPYTNGVAYAVPTMTSQFVGWIFRTDPSAENGLRQANVEIVGPSALMQNMGMTSQYMEVNALPANWQQAVPDVCNLSWMIWYMLYYHSNILDLFDFNPFTVSATNYRRYSKAIPAGSLWDQVTKLAADMVGCQIGCDSAGAIWVSQPYSRQVYGSRPANRDSYNEGMIKNYDLPRRQRPALNKILGQAFWSDSTKDYPLQCNAPGLARSQGIGEETETYTVNNQDELNKLIGNTWQEKNSLYEDGKFTIEQNRDVLEPAQMQPVGLSIASKFDSYATGLNINAQVMSVSKRYNSDGTRDLDVTFRTETSGQAAATVIVPPPPINVVAPPPATLSNAWGAQDTYIPDGWNMIHWAGFVFLLSGTTTGALAARDITPYSIYTPDSSHHTPGGILDPWNYERIILLYDNTIAYTNDKTASSPIWVDASVTPPSGWFWDWGIWGSINRQDYFCWIGTKSSDHSKRFYYTTDNFTTISHTDIPNSDDAGYHDSATLSSQFSSNGYSTNVQVMLYPFSTLSNGIIYVHLTRKGSTSKTYKSTDWGATFTDTGQVDGMTGYIPASNGELYGSMTNLPYSLPGGAKNLGPTLMYREYSNYGDGAIFPTRFRHHTYNVVDNSHFVDFLENGTPVNGMLPAGNRCMNSFTLDGRYATIVLTPGDFSTLCIYMTDDGGASWHFATVSGASSYGFQGINGWPTNKRFAVLFGYHLQYTIDRFATSPIDLSSSYVAAITPLVASHSLLNPALAFNPIVDCIPDLSIRYPIGGVHPV